jgi:glucan phosphoethanolaminetransferase (alkaline phosphatase superfamily)
VQSRFADTVLLARSGLAGFRQPILRYLLLGIVVLAPFIIWMPYGGRIELRIAYGLLAAGLCVLAIASRLAFVLACLLLIAPAVLHQHVGRHWGSGQFDARAEAYYESPAGETHEYLQSHVDAIDIAFLISAALYAIFLIRWTMRSGNAPRPLRRLAACAVVAGLIVFAGLRLDRYLKHFGPYEMASQAVKARERYQQLSTRSAFLAQSPLASGNCTSRYDKVVIVLGESATSDHMSVFGYEKPTTPFALESGAHAFDALSPSNQTRFSLGMMLTRAAPGGFDSFYTSHSLIAELRSCGLHTLWISNQGQRGEYDSFSTSLAREADEQIFLNEWSWKETQLDGKIVDVLEERGAYRKTGQVTFIHLIGSHTDYDKRVPAGFGFQGASDLVSQYDNTILYTDHVLSELYRRFAGGSLLFIYVSDHGQLVSESKFGSGFMPGYKEEFRTPLLVWTEDHAAVKAIRDAIGDSRLNLESFDDVVRYLVGMTLTPQVSTREAVSILTPDYVKDYSELESLSDD